MSRIGSKPIKLVSGVNVDLNSNTGSGTLVNIKGPLGDMSVSIDKEISISLDQDELQLIPIKDNYDNSVAAKWGLYRSLVNNMIIGVSSGFKKEMELIGVGYRASVEANILDLSVGHSHHDIISLPQEIKASVVAAKGQPPRIILESFDKQLLGQVCACIRAIRPPEPYKGKGIRFVGELVRRKAGKTAKK